MEYMIIIYLLMLLVPQVGWSTQQMRTQGEQYVRTGTIPNACLVAGDPRFPATYIQRNGPCPLAAPKPTPPPVIFMYESAPAAAGPAAVETVETAPPRHTWGRQKRSGDY